MLTLPPLFSPSFTLLLKPPSDGHFFWPAQHLALIQVLPSLADQAESRPFTPELSSKMNNDRGLPDQSVAHRADV